MDLPPPRVLVVGSQHDVNCQAVRNFLTLNRISHEWITRETERIRVPASLSEEAQPIAVLIDGAQWVRPPVTVRTVARALGYRTQASGDSYDVVIVGGGPAGLAAAIYGASEGLKVLLIERNAAGGQAGNSTRIENYLGFPNGVSGDDLSERAVRQSVRFGSEIVLTRKVRGIRALSCGNYRIEMDGNDCVKTKALILATGVEWRPLKAEGVAQFLGRGVFYGASRAESSTVAGKDIFIVGGGNSAGQAAIFYADYARSVTVLVRGRELRSNMSQYLIENLARKSNVAVETSTELVVVGGQKRVEYVRTLHKQEESVQRKADCIFVMIGANAATDWLPPDIERDQNGYVCTGRDVSQLSTWNEGRLPFSLETSLPGIFCVGDVRHGSVKRVSSAVGEGGIAIASIHQYLAITSEELIHGTQRPRASG
ncbi:MAG: FAD-dependent oxidoreductase [Bryobacteraceae bacterium]